MNTTIRARIGLAVVQALLGAALAVGVVAPAGSQPSGPGAGDGAARGSWVVLLRDGTDPATVAGAVGADRRHTYTSALSGFAADLTSAQLQALDQDGRVLAVTPNRLLRRPTPTEATTPPVPAGPGPADEPAGCTPSGAMPSGHPAQFVTSGLQRTGGLESPTAAIDCRPDPMDVDIAVVDTGVFDHIDLNLAGGADCHTGEGFDDEDGHGTLVAGFAAAEDNAYGAVGVAPGARIWAVRVADPDGTISLANTLCGLDWIQSNGGIEVANLSFGDTGLDTGNCGLASAPLLDVRSLGIRLSVGLAEREVIDPQHFAICRVEQAGTTVVVSAGNDTADTTLVTPAAYSEVVTVSGYSDLDGRPGSRGGEPCPSEPQEGDDRLASFSNHGQPVDIAAPSVCITSTVPPLFPDSPGTGSYETATGTSFSAPLVAGAVALVKARNPRWSPEQVRSHLLGTAEPGPIPGDPDRSPEGVLNLRHL